MHKPLSWLSPLLLVMIFFAVIITELTGFTAPSYVGAVCLLLFAVREWPKSELSTKVIAVIALGVTIALLIFEQVSIAQLIAQSAAVVYFSFFLMALNLLKDAALSSQSVSLTGLALLQQHPTKRYALLTFASHLLGILMSMGAINLLATMINKSLTNNPDFDSRIKQIRQKRMLLAVMRGFASIPLWAPSSVTITLLVTTIPQLKWMDIIPYGLYLAGALLLFGIALDHVQAPKKLQHLVPALTNKTSDLKVSYPILLVVVTLTCLCAVLMYHTNLRPITAVLLSATLVSVLWIFCQYCQQHVVIRAVQLTKTRFTSDIFFALPQQRSEILFFAASILLGRLLLQVIDIHWLNEQISQSNLSVAWLLILASWSMVLAAFMYINPMISATLIAGALSQLPLLANMPVTIALVTMVTWSVIIGSCPTTSSVRIGANISAITPVQMGLKWNGLYAVIVLLLLDAAILLWV